MQILLQSLQYPDGIEQRLLAKWVGHPFTRHAYLAAETGALSHAVPIANHIMYLFN
jgi:hypothetical protein